MTKCIDKSALVAEIKARISDIEVSHKAGLIKKGNADKKILLFKSVLSLIDTLEVKEVDLEKTINNYFKDWKFDEELDIMVKPNNYSATFDDIKEVAKHFFELGLRSTITEEDCKLIWNIGDEIPNMPEEEFYKEVLKRFQDYKERKEK